MTFRDIRAVERGGRLRASPPTSRACRALLPGFGWAAIPIIEFAWRLFLSLALCMIVMLVLALLVAGTTGGCGGAPHVADALKSLAGRVCVGTDSVRVCIEKCERAEREQSDGGRDR